MAGLYLNDDLRNGALMADIGGSLIGLCAVKGYISSVGEVCQRHSGIIPGACKSGVGRKPTLGLLPLSWIRDAR